MSRFRLVTALVAACALATGAGASAGPLCLGDVAPDGNVGFEDVIVLLGQWGPCPPPEEDCIADLDEDRVVGMNDLLIVFANWGPCPE